MQSVYAIDSRYFLLVNGEFLREMREERFLKF